MIPNKIHYCWFGDKPLTKLAKKCIDSWKKYCPNYEVIQWDENNFDINCCRYVKEAYDNRKWAFVSDFARLDILYKNGGIYFDTDVELVNSIDDIIIKGNFFAIEESGNVNPGLGMGAEKNSIVIHEILQKYYEDNFINPDGSFNLNTIVTKTTSVLRAYGMKNIDTIQKVSDFTIYPKEYFNPMDIHTGKINITKNTKSIHYYSASWTTTKNKINAKIARKINKIAMPFTKKPII